MFTTITVPKQVLKRLQKSRKALTSGALAALPSSILDKHRREDGRITNAVLILMGLDALEELVARKTIGSKR